MLQVLRAFPKHNGCRSTKEQIKKILNFVCNIEPIPLTNNAMPRGAKLLIQALFDHLGSSLVTKGRKALEQTKQKEESKKEVMSSCFNCLSGRCKMPDKI